MTDTLASLGKDETLRLLQGAMPGASVRIVDTTHRHVAHNEAVGHHGSHLVVEVVWEGFAGQSRLQRHRRVFDVLGEAWQGSRIHSLSLRLHAPDEAGAVARGAEGR